MFAWGPTVVCWVCQVAITEAECHKRSQTWCKMENATGKESLQSSYGQIASHCIFIQYTCSAVTLKYGPVDAKISFRITATHSIKNR